VLDRIVTQLGRPPFASVLWWLGSYDGVSARANVGFSSPYRYVELRSGLAEETTR
jgi:hypothetical protein